MKPEILSPVGSFDSFYAAINAGCDAIYLAGNNYGARKATFKFNNEDIEKIIKISHTYGVKVYITINTIIFDDEIEELIEYTDNLYLMGADAFIVQDIGLVSIFNKRYSDLDIHISTQANVKTLEEIKFFESFKNVKRVVLARETPIEEIKRIKENTKLEIEVFVHGAICMGYSGNCLFSSLTTKRSGNRGECAQLCRLKYSLYENNTEILKDKFLLSPKELNTSEYIKELINLNIESFKIEGRAKSSEYVYYVTKLYKTLTLNLSPTKDDLFSVRQAYNREFTKGYIFNEDSNDLVNTYRPNHQGIKLGTIINSNKNSVTLKLENDVNRLDGVRILSINSDDDYGFTVDKILVNGKEKDYGKTGETVSLITYKVPNKLLSGLNLIKTSSISLTKNIDDITKKVLIKNINLNLLITLKKNEYPILRDLVSDTLVKADFKVLEASNKPITKDIIYNQLSKLENTPFNIQKIDYLLDDNIFIPLGVLNNLRRNLIDEILSKRKHTDRIINKNYSFKPIKLEKIENVVTIGVETYSQFIKSYELGYKNFYIHNYELFKKIEHDYKNINISYAKERIIEKYNNDSEYTSYLISEVGSLKKDSSNKYFLSPYLNISNIYAAHTYFKLGANKIELSYELTESRINSFVDNFTSLFNYKPNIELVIYDRCDLMISKYCLIKHKYNSKSHCMRCKNNEYSLKDRNNFYLPVKGMNNCGNRILNSKILCLFDYIDSLNNNGINNFVINFTIESENEVDEVLKTFKEKEPLTGPSYTFGRFKE